MTEQPIITKEILKEWNACDDGYARFCELMPEGATLEEAIAWIGYAANFSISRQDSYKTFQNPDKDIINAVYPKIKY